MLYLCTRFKYIHLKKEITTDLDVILCVYSSLYNKKKTNEKNCSFLIGRSWFYYQFDDEDDDANDGANIFTFGLAVRPSKRLYV